MTKKIFCILLVFLSFGAFSNAAMAAETPPVATSKNAEAVPVEIRSMIDRLNEIKDLDKSALDRHDKKALRKELRDLKKAVRKSGNGLYISSGAIIIILLLIIIL
ncbi:hypothetical protein ACFFU9_01770 [Mariniflexile ostreae]|uniref:Seryl-tRNA synthetase n=1 Tax=Mariniflexile ostreae TaxID=1520892 RepID=A0ABV5F7P0_9FLAO